MAAQLLERVADVVRNDGRSAGPESDHLRAPCKDEPGLLDATRGASVRWWLCGSGRWPVVAPASATGPYRSGGGTRFLVACSKAYAISSSRGSLHARPVKLTPKGDGRASKPAGKGGVGALGTRPKGTITVG